MIDEYYRGVKSTSPPNYLGPIKAMNFSVEKKASNESTVPSDNF